MCLEPQAIKSPDQNQGADSHVFLFCFYDKVRLHVPARVRGRWSAKHQAYTLKPSKLPLFVDSEWSLDFGLPASLPSYPWQASSSNSSSVGVGQGLDSGQLAPRADSRHTHDSSDMSQHVAPHVLHMVLYVPPASEQPLVIMDGQGGMSPTNSFWVPNWGGVHIANRNVSSQEQKDATEQQGDGGATALLSHAQMLGFAGSAVGMLRQLFGLPEHPDAYVAAAGKLSTGRGGGMGAVQMLPASSTGVTEWEVDALQRARTQQDVAATARVLAGLSRVVEAVPNLEMPDLVGQQVSASLSALSLAVRHVLAGHYEEASTAARTARIAAEVADSHPAILAQLSFPQSHRLGECLLVLLVPTSQGCAVCARWLTRW